MIKKLFSSQFRRNMSSGVITTVINTLIILISYPVYLHFLGYEKLGIWMVLSTVLSFIQMFNLGMGPAITKLVAEEYGRNNIHGIQIYVNTAIWTLVTTGGIALIILILFAKPIIGLFNLSPENSSIALRLLPFIGILTIYAFLMQILTATLSGLGRMDQSNYRDSICRLISVAVAISLLFLGNGIVSLVIGMALSYVLMHIISVLLIHKIANIHILKFNWDVKRFRKLISFGGSVLGGSIISMLFSPFNKLMLSRYAGVATVPIYEIAFTGSMQIRSLIESTFRALVPEISRISADFTVQANNRISQIYSRSMKLIFLLGTPVFVAIAVNAPILLKVWLGDKFVETLPGIFRIMLIGTFLSLLSVPAYNFLLGLGHVRVCFFSHVISSIVNLIIVIGIVTLYHNLTIIDVAYITILGIACSMIYLIWQLHQKINILKIGDIRMKSLLKRIIPTSILQPVLKVKHTLHIWILSHIAKDFSQSGETVVVRHLMRPFTERSFVEIGANDGITVSTTLGLIMDGWNGLSVEANPRVFEKLKRNLACFPKVRTFCCAASPIGGKVKLYLGKNDFDGLLSTLSTEDSHWYRENRSTDFIEVDSLTLTEILAVHSIPQRFGLLLIDTEGMDLDILQVFDFRRFRPRLIITEDYAPKNPGKFELLKNAGYVFKKRVGCNTFWLDIES